MLRARCHTSWSFNSPATLNKRFNKVQSGSLDFSFLAKKIKAPRSFSKIELIARGSTKLPVPSCLWGDVKNSPTRESRGKNVLLLAPFPFPPPPPPPARPLHRDCRLRELCNWKGHDCNFEFSRNVLSNEQRVHLKRLRVLLTLGSILHCRCSNLRRGSVRSLRVLVVGGERSTKKKRKRNSIDEGNATASLPLVSLLTARVFLMRISYA